MRIVALINDTIGGFTNLFTLSKFKLWDPELNTNNGTSYPNTSSYSIGVRFSF